MRRREMPISKPKIEYGRSRGNVITGGKTNEAAGD